MLVALSLLIATPAAAAVTFNNYMSGTFEPQEACFTKVAGSDTSPAGSTAVPRVQLDPNATVTTTAGTTVVQEAMYVVGFAGDTTLFRDAVRFVNGCDYDIDLLLRVETDPAGRGPLTGNWSDRNVKVYLSTQPAQVTAPFSNAAWDQSPLNLANAAPSPGDSAGAAGRVINAQTGTVRVPTGKQFQGGVSVDFGTSAHGASTVYWTAVATKASTTSTREKAPDHKE